MDETFQKNLKHKECFWSQSDSEKKLMGIGELLAKTFQIFKERTPTLLAIAALAIVANIILGIGGIISGFFLAILKKDLVIFGFVFLVIMIIFAFLINLFYSWITASIIFALAEKKNFGQAIRNGWQKTLSLFWVTILVTIIVLAGSILFIIPGIILAIWFALVGYFVVLEEKRGVSALRASKQLVSGYWWNVFVRLSAAVLVGGIISFLLALIPIVGNIFVILFNLPFYLIFGFLLYLDLKRVKGI